MILLGYNLNGDVMAYAGVQLFRSYISATLDFLVFCNIN